MSSQSKTQLQGLALPEERTHYSYLERTALVASKSELVTKSCPWCTNARMEGHCHWYTCRNFFCTIFLLLRSLQQHLQIPTPSVLKNTAKPSLVYNCGMKGCYNNTFSIVLFPTEQAQCTCLHVYVICSNIPVTFADIPCTCNHVHYDEIWHGSQSYEHQ